MRQTYTTLFTCIQRGQVEGFSGDPIFHLGNADLALRNLAHAGQGLNQFGLAVALYTRDPQDFACTHIKAHTVQHLEVTI